MSFLRQRLGMSFLRQTRHGRTSDGQVCGYGLQDVVSASQDRVEVFNYAGRIRIALPPRSGVLPC